MMQWGVMPPEQIGSQKRTRTLGLNSVTRQFNELAVPGLGGVKYVKPVFLACLGIQVAQQVRDLGKHVNNLQVTNAIEALACYLGYKENNWQPNQRLRGITKLRAPKNTTYDTFSAAHFYVTQPMRMSTVQALPALGLVNSKGERFNNFRLSEQGADLVSAGCAITKINVTNFLTQWVLGRKQLPHHPYQLTRVLAPHIKLDTMALAIFRQALLSGNEIAVIRRKAILEWVKYAECKAWKSWQRPHCIDASHFNDLKSGAYFFALRDKALGLLNVIEVHILGLQSKKLKLSAKLPNGIQDATTLLRQAATAFLALSYDPTCNKEATMFAKSCAQQSDIAVIQFLVEKDEVVLRYIEQCILPAAAFGDPDPVHSEPDNKTQRFAPNISYRVPNMYQLNRDFEGKEDDTDE
ncbi:hypothetical protein [Pseudoalteromonas peptidolytica]|uniref:hypothetical protein n=1 Tax=Pseudoalteromonas peptidolytica TaxID=61150 RepID=UPI00298E0F93|nr:hypothetical protein [Pseudoalteromonas peptidolytica]MDW7548157.1 hypothetical protein [Pseudoalteromonas peptidolytica]